MDRKRYRVFGAFIVLGLILAACGGGAPATTPASESQPAVQSEVPAPEPPGRSKQRTSQ
jgi:hypothetical protein